ncbi:MAG: hypothetical protein ACYS1A_19700 [Planctomycetota bacterium]|jgi:hypothetical protein
MEKMNEKGSISAAIGAIFGITYIAAAIIILALLAVIWLFWKGLFVFAIGLAVIYFAFFIIPQMVKGKEGLRYVGIAAAIGALVVILSFLPLWAFSIYAPGAEAPLTGEITFSKEATAGTMVKVNAGEALSATFDGQWFNRSLSPFGNATAGLNWRLDGTFIEMAEGTVEGVSKEYVTGTNPEAGAIAKQVWQWTTLPFAAKLPVQGQTVAINKTVEIDTANLPIGLHQVTINAFSISPAEESESLFACGAVNGACCPLQSQMNCLAFGESCCQKNWCGANWCSSVAPGQTFWQSGWLFASCDNGPRTQFGSWQETVKEQVTEEQVIAAAKSGDFVVALAEFEVVNDCPTECCVDEPGYEDRLCTGSQVCTAGQCITPIQECPFACCENEPAYQNKACAAGENCLNNSCIFEPPPPPVPVWEQIIQAILAWITSIFNFFFSITGETVVQPGQTYVYTIAISAPVPDTDFTDGTMQYQYGNWALVNNNGLIVQEGEWESVEGTYAKEVSITVPQALGNHALIGVIHQYDLSFNFGTGEWETVREAVVAKEGIDLRTTLPAPQAPVPILSLLGDIIAGIWQWILGLFGLA